MSQSSPSPPRAGGFVIAAGILLGAIAGIAVGQPSLGLVIGAVFGLLAAVLMWLADRRR